ncbi:UPF0236 family transposase-like protein [Sellimonas intestinalis]|uniref:UPF0236 family transposase-like protein n=1 Tax=Sellimonas intestinalis TaxID=1653434 RepID=UPI0015EC5475|nr:UPF0236 family protein [Sellimonas intestinalis]
MEGEKAVGILFEEMDGVWLRMQDSRHKKAPKKEMKVFTMYEGWDADSPKRSRLVNKKMLVGMEKSSLFHRKREALIAKVYDADEIGQRILNGDGGSWIKETYDPEAIFQLDRFHIYQEIKRKIRDKEAQERIKELLEEKKVEELLEYILIYADSIETEEEKDKGSEKARELH